MKRTLSDFATMLLFMVFVLALVVLGPDMRENATCPDGTLTWTETQLFMGRGIPASAGGGEVSDAQWQEFTDAEIIPRFGSGFTVLNGAGYWKGEGCTAANLPGGCERTKLLLVQYAPSKEADAAVTAVANAYRTRFSQQSVMRSDSPVCTQFYAG